MVAAPGIASGDLYFDEAIDRLDAEGVAAMVGVLEELAETRLVMLITHNEELKDSVRWSRCLHVEKGVVTG